MGRAMKDSGIDWIGEIPKEWKVNRATNDFVQSFSKGNEELTLLSATQTEGVVPKDTLEGVVQVKLDADLSVFKTVHTGDHVISLRSFQGGFELSNYEGVITPALPPIREQQLIADFLDCKCGLINSTIEKQKAVIEKLKLYKQSVITEAVTKGLNPIAKMKTSGIEWIGDIPEGWEVRKLKGIGEAIIGLTYSPTEVSDKGILVLRSSNVQNGKIVVLDDNVYVDKKIQDKLIVKAGDILICSRNGSKALIGKCAYIDEATAGHSFGAFMTVFRSVHNRFLFYVFNSAIFSFHLGTFLTSTITPAHFVFELKSGMRVNKNIC
jgi:type I restriction enzyme S subunit